MESTMYPSLISRNPDLQFSDNTPVIWFYDNIYLTQYMNSLGCILPVIEKYLIQQVRIHLKEVKSLELKEHLAVFIQQEAQHSMKHLEFNDWLTNSGLDIDDEIRKMNFLLKICKKIFSKKFNLAICAFMEHYTWAFSNALLRAPEVIDTMDESVRRLVVWHCIEEIEHRSSIIDLYRHIGGGRLQAILAAGVTIIIWNHSFFGRVKRFLNTNPQERIHRDKEIANDLIKKHLDLKSFNQNIVAFFRHDFRANFEADRELIAQWQEKYEFKKSKSSTKSRHP